ncbi:MAG: hypothetical protein IKJ32_04185 [Clostridia bacterium]|nr:hypothetical protein [Clostridia bacterium]
MYELPDSPGARALVQYLRERIAQCDELEYVNEDTRVGDEYYAQEVAYKDILDKIKIV